MLELGFWVMKPNQNQLRIGVFYTVAYVMLIWSFNALCTRGSNTMQK